VLCYTKYRVCVTHAGPGGDATSDTEPVPSYAEELSRQAADSSSSSSKPLQGVTVGLITEALTSGGVQSEVAAAVRTAAAALAELGATVQEVSLPKLPQQCAAYYVNALSEASANLARFDGVRYGARDAAAGSAKAAMLRSRHDGFGAEVRQRILLGTFSLSAGYSDAYYAKAQAIRAGLREDFAAVFAACDLLLCPTAPTTAYKLGEAAEKGVASYKDDLFTVPASLAGLPALSLPCGIDSAGLPIGLQIIGPRMAENAVLRAGFAYERATQWRELLAPGVAADSGSSSASSSATAAAVGVA
jgi:aspartyl-tRNA(Asn)/glutamyl-tRNA(Gln) amidotransferase subunit A